MDIQNAVFDALGNIGATVDGIDMTIPSSGANRHYREIISQGIVPAPYVDPAATTAVVSAEAERRIEAGTVIAGNVFRCDTTSIARLSGLLDYARNLEAAMQPVAITFNTAAGATITLASAADVEAVFNAASGFVAAVLAASSAIQGDAGLSAMTAADVQADARWP